MTATYAPGTVAVATVRGVPGVRVFRVRKAWAWVDPTERVNPSTYVASYDAGGDVTDIRPLVVLDLDNEPVTGDISGRNEAKMLVDMLRETADNFFTPDAAALARKVANTIEAQTKPPKPDVNEHLVYQKRGKTAEAVCGKTWIPSAEVTVVGKCSECSRIAESGWLA